MEQDGDSLRSRARSECVSAAPLEFAQNNGDAFEQREPAHRNFRMALPTLEAAVLPGQVGHGEMAHLLQ